MILGQTCELAAGHDGSHAVRIVVPQAPGPDRRSIGLVARFLFRRGRRWRRVDPRQFVLVETPSATDLADSPNL